MTPAGFNSREETFRSAVEADDLTSLNAALQDYLTWFGSEPRSRTEVAAARDLMESCLRTAAARRTSIAAQIARLTTVSAGYGASRVSNTWRLDA
jgi:hypothetical protein